MVRALSVSVVLVLLTACSGGGGGHPKVTTTTVSRERAAARVWSKQAATAYAPLELTARELPTRARAWLAGERPDADFDADLNVASAEVTKVRDLVAALPPFGPDPAVNELYRSSSLLYVEYIHLEQTALATPPSALRGQLDLAGRRVRVLADRIFDRGQARVDRLLDEPASPDVVINLPPEVPDWTAEGLAAGPPLDDPPPPAATTPALREEERPTQPRPAWAAAVAAAGAPAPGELTGAIDSADAGSLRDLAHRYDAVARALHAVADPVGPHGRDDGAQVRLGLLVAEEAARAAQAGQPAIARQLAVIAAAVAAT